MSDSLIIERFGASVRKLRFRLGISQEALAERADLHRTYIADIERGARNVTLRSIYKLAKALEVSTADLLMQTCSRGSPAPHSSEQVPARELPDILLVADDPDEVDLILGAFRKAGIANKIHVSRRGGEALDYVVEAEDLKHNPPAVILLDSNLPRARRKEVLARLKGNPRTRKIPVVLLTPSESDPDIEESRKLGADAYIVKPVDFANFSQITAELSLLWAV